jgi:hypothetical protein
VFTERWTWSEQDCVGEETVSEKFKNHVIKVVFGSIEFLINWFLKNVMSPNSPVVFIF